MSELQENRECETHTITESEGIVNCERLATVRVTRFGREELNDDGEWERKRIEEYVCDEHFDHKFMNYPFYAKLYGMCDREKDTPPKLEPWTFKRVSTRAK